MVCQYRISGNQRTKTPLTISRNEKLKLIKRKQSSQIGNALKENSNISVLQKISQLRKKVVKIIHLQWHIHSLHTKNRVREGSKNNGTRRKEKLSKSLSNALIQSPFNFLFFFLFKSFFWTIKNEIEN
jgi:hypothetical protein